MRKHLSDIYKLSFGLLTDLYELTMAYSYWKSGTLDKEAVFCMFFRKNPFQGGYAVSCGLGYLVDLLTGLQFSEDDIAYLSGLRGNDGKPIFAREFLDYLGAMRFSCDVDAVPDGSVVFKHEPLVRVRGPIIQAQLLESAVLNVMNFQTLIATKAARLKEVAGDETVLEFGLRRAQGIDGSLSASLAAYVGGCDSTSNTMAGRLFGIPVAGTHAHSWIMSFDSELEAFRVYAEVMPNNCIFLVDTYDTIEGVKNAIRVGRWLRENGHEMLGIRLDSGDLAYLSIEARKLLDEAGFHDARIVASSDLDEEIVHSLHDQGARVDIWGVGTKLVTGHDQPALGGVYKLTALREPGGQWERKLKLSEQAAKTSNPGIQQVRRFCSNGYFIGDMIFDELSPPGDKAVMVDPLDITRRKTIPRTASYSDLLVPIFRDGELVYKLPPLKDSKELARRQLAGFHPGIKRLLHPHEYPVGLEQSLNEFKIELILQARGYA